MIGWFEALVLGVVQGVTEYLPVSSSGHLVIFQALFGLTEPALFFDIVLHAATLIAVVWYYWTDLTTSLAGLVAGIGRIARGESIRRVYETDEGFRLWTLIVAGTIPTGIIGVGFKDYFETLFGAPWRVGLMLMVTGLILLSTRFAGEGGRTIGRFRLWEAVVIGVAQGMAITPGISRSGTTIAAALLMGVERETAARFSFLLSLPSIAGALILKFEPSTSEATAAGFAVGFIASLLTGYLCLAFLVAIVKRGGLSWFAWYCFAVGGATMAFLG
jgi:undecaprenyl-diphosphatase